MGIGSEFFGASPGAEVKIFPFMLADVFGCGGIDGHPADRVERFRKNGRIGFGICQFSFALSGLVAGSAEIPRPKPWAEFLHRVTPQDSRLAAQDCPGDYSVGLPMHYIGFARRLPPDFKLIIQKGLNS
jgi:hypothetical protein